MKTIGEIIQEKRKELQMSRSKLSELSGVSATAIKQYETNMRTPQIAQLVKLASIFHMSLEDFLPSQEAKDEVRDLIEESKSYNHDINKSTLYFIGEALLDAPYEIFNEAEKKSDAILIDSLQQFSDKYLEVQLLETFQSLNRRGKLEALQRLEELAEITRFHQK